MAKTESTAVNELIELVATQKPLAADPSEDLMFRAPARTVSAPRMTSTVPPIRGGIAASTTRLRAAQRFGDRRGRRSRRFVGWRRPRWRFHRSVEAARTTCRLSRRTR
jgi:hypothetical protein